MGASATAKAWNGGTAGAPRPVNAPVRSACPAEGCGDEAELPGQPRAGLVRVAVRGSREPARWYCPGCTAYGQALSEVRAIGGGEGA